MFINTLEIHNNTMMNIRHIIEFMNNTLRTHNILYCYENVSISIYNKKNNSNNSIIIYSYNYE